MPNSTLYAFLLSFLAGISTLLGSLIIFIDKNTRFSQRLIQSVIEWRVLILAICPFIRYNQNRKQIRIRDNENRGNMYEIKMDCRCLHNCIAAGRNGSISAAEFHRTGLQSDRFRSGRGLGLGRLSEKGCKLVRQRRSGQYRERVHPVSGRE